MVGFPTVGGNQCLAPKNSNNFAILSPTPVICAPNTLGAFSWFSACLAHSFRNKAIVALSRICWCFDLTRHKVNFNEKSTVLFVSFPINLCIRSRHFRFVGQFRLFKYLGYYIILFVDSPCDQRGCRDSIVRVQISICCAHSY